MTTIANLLNWLTIALAYLYTTEALFRIAKKHKAKHAWYAFIPFFNYYLMCKLVGKPSWWLALLFIPIANTITLIIVWTKFQKIKNKEDNQFDSILKNLF